MAVTKAELETMDFSFKGEPFVRISDDDTIETKGLDYSFQGQPFIAAESGTTTSVFVPKVIMF